MRHDPKAGPTGEPQTPEEWQVAVDAAYCCLCLDSARQYGLVTGGPVVNVERCVDMLRRGKLRGVVPADDAVDRYVAELMAKREKGGG